MDQHPSYLKKVTSRIDDLEALHTAAQYAYKRMSSFATIYRRYGLFDPCEVIGYSIYETPDKTYAIDLFFERVDEVGYTKVPLLAPNDNDAIAGLLKTGERLVFEDQEKDAVFELLHIIAELFIPQTSKKLTRQSCVTKNPFFRSIPTVAAAKCKHYRFAETPSSPDFAEIRPTAIIVSDEMTIEQGLPDAEILQYQKNRNTQQKGD